MADTKIPDGWSIQTLDGKVKILSGFPFKSSLFTDDSSFMGVIRIRDLEKQSLETFYAGDFEQDYIVKRGDILIGMDGDFNIVKWNTGNALLNQRICKIEAETDSGFDTNFLFQSLKDDLLSINAATGATTVKHLSVKDIRGIEKAFPPLPEQQKIATILTSVDTVIEKTRAQIDKLKHLKTGMMQELLTKGIGHTEFKDSPVGSIPKGWEVKTIADLGQVVTGNTPKTNDLDNYGGNIPFVSPADLDDSAYIKATKSTITEKGLLETRELPKGSVCVVCIGSTIGKTGITTKRCATNQQINSVICESTYSEYVYYLLTYYSSMIKSEAGTQAVPIINKSSFSALKVQIPPYEEQVKIGKSLSGVDCKITAIARKLSGLEKTKKALMQDLLSGKVRVDLS